MQELFKPSRKDLILQTLFSFRGKRAREKEYSYRNFLISELLAKVRNLPFDCLAGSQLRVNGLRLKLFKFSVRGELVEPQKNTFARGSSYNAI